MKQKIQFLIYLFATQITWAFENITLPFINGEVKVPNLKLAVLVPPDFVDKTYFKKLIKSDCEKYQNDLIKIIQLPSKEARILISEIRTLPLELTMKPSYEINFEISENEKLRFDHSQAELSEISKKLNLEVDSAEQIEFKARLLRFKTRDLLCDFIRHQIKMSSENNIVLEMAPQKVDEAISILKNLSEINNHINSLGEPDYIKAVRWGYAIDSQNLSLESVFKNLFLSESFKLNSFWPENSKDLSSVYQKEIVLKNKKIIIEVEDI